MLTKLNSIFNELSLTWHDIARGSDKNARFPRAENLEFLNLIHHGVEFPLVLVFKISWYRRQGHPDRADRDPGAAVQDRDPDPGQPPEGARDRQGQTGDTLRQAGQADPHQVS